MAISSVHPLRIFISHSAKDNDFCVKLVDDLRRALGEHAQIWYDASDEEHGNKGDEGESSWLPEFEAQAVAEDTQDVLLVLLSPDAVASTRVNNEIDLAWQRKNSSGHMHIIPVLYRPCEVRQDIDTLQIVSFLPPKTYDAAFAELLTAIATVNSTPPAEVTTFAALPSQIAKPKPRLSWPLREFEWFDSEHTFVQVSFPGIYPDLTRFQAESDQANADRGQDPWKRDAKATAQHFAADLLAWDGNSPATLENGGGVHDLRAVVSVKNTSASGGTIKVMLGRLTGNGNGGIWEVTDVKSAGIAINSPESRRFLSNPVDVDVTVDSTLKGQKGALLILDHLYKAIGSVSVSDLLSANLPQILFFSSLGGMGGSPRYPYAEEGIMVLVIGDASGKIIAAAMQKELLGS